MLKLHQRNRRQEGWVELDKSTKPHAWKARWLDWSQVRVDKSGRTRPKQRSHLLGPKTKEGFLTKSKAESEWAKKREKVMADSGGDPVCIPTFTEFALGAYREYRTCRRKWRQATSDKFAYLISLTSTTFGKKRLASIAPAEIQQHLNKLAGTFCHDTVSGSLVYVRAIFRYASEEEFIPKDPSRRLVLPQTNEPYRPFTALDQVARLEGVLSGLDLTILRTFTRCGLRAGEVFGLQVGDLQPDKTLKICRTFSKGKVGPPKTNASAKPVPVPDALYRELLSLIETLLDQSPDAWLFPSSVKRGSVVMPLRAENWLKRVLKPAAKDLGFKITLHSLRRGWGTEAHNHGQNMKDIQGVMRHASMSTTSDTYVRPVPQSLRNTVEKMDELMRDAAEKFAGTLGTAQTTP